LAIESDSFENARNILEKDRSILVPPPYLVKVKEFAVSFQIHSRRKTRTHAKAATIKAVNLKSDMPLAREALQRLDHELAVARQEKVAVLKVIHGYGSTGAGGDIRLAVQKRLLELIHDGQIRACIFGENWSKSDEQTWRLLQGQPTLKSDSDLGRGNRGITIVLL
jgi:hypothetical protein